MAIKKKTSGKSVVAKSKKVSAVKKSKKPLLVKKKVSVKKAIVLKKPIAKKQTPIKKVAAKKSAVKSKTAVKNKKVSVKKLAPKKAVKKSPAKTLVKKQVKKVAVKTIKPIKKEANVKLEKKTNVDKKSSAPVEISVEKTLKVGVKTRKQLVAEPPQPVIEVSNHPKTKVKTILISQPKPDNDKNPYYDLSKKYNLIETFRQFIKIEGLPVKDFRNQRVDILEHKAVILTSRLAVDHYFRMCNEMRVTVPESMKYFQNV